MVGKTPHGWEPSILRAMRPQEKTLMRCGTGTIWAPWLSELGEGSVGISSAQVFCQICFRPDVAPQLPLVDNKLPSP